MSFFAAGFSAFAGTLGPGDTLWVPSGVFVLESVADNEDCFGIRWSMVVPRDEERYKLFKATASNKMTAATHLSKFIVEVGKKLVSR